MAHLVPFECFVKALAAMLSANGSFPGKLTNAASDIASLGGVLSTLSRQREALNRQIDRAHTVIINREPFRGISTP